MGRTLIISDVHLPRGRMDASRPLRGLLEQCDRLVVNGDLAELHHPGLAGESRRHLEELEADAKALGTELELLGGNHDPEITPLRALGFAEDRIIVTHGDAFTRRIAPWSRHASLLEQASRDNRMTPSHWLLIGLVNIHTTEAESLRDWFSATVA